MVIPGMLNNLAFDVPNHPLSTSWWCCASLKALVGFPQQQTNHGGRESPVFPSRRVICTWDCCSSSLMSPQSIQIFLWQSSVMGVSPQSRLMDKPCQYGVISVNEEKGISSSPSLLARGHHGNNLQQQKEMGVLGFLVAADGGVFLNNSSFSGWFSWLPSSTDLQGLEYSVGTEDG